MGGGRRRAWRGEIASGLLSLYCFVTPNIRQKQLLHCAQLGEGAGIWGQGLMGTTGSKGCFPNIPPVSFTRRV